MATTKHLILSAVVAMVSFVSVVSTSAQVTLPDIAEQTVRGAADQFAVINDNGAGTFPAAAVGFLRVKYVNDGNPAGSTANGATGGDQTSCAKTYFRWSFVGQPNPDTNSDLQMTWANAGNSTASTMTLWSLNQPYPFLTGLTGATSPSGGFTGPGGTNPAVTFANAQANDTNYDPVTFIGTFQMLTNGPYTATPVVANFTPGLGNVTVTIPAPWGNLIHQNAGSNELVFCLGGVTTNQGANGFRIANNSAALVYNSILGTNPPSISLLTNMIVIVNQSATNSFTVADPDGNPANILQAQVTSSDQTGTIIVGVSVSGSGAHQQVIVMAGGAAGSATVEVTITDEKGDEAQRTFNVTVVPQILPPSISTPANTNTLSGTPVIVPFTIGDASAPLSSLATNAMVDPNSVNVLASAVIGGTGANLTVTVTPVPGTNGVGLVDLSVSDKNGNTTTTSFAVIVQTSAQTVFSDIFNYANGSLLAVDDGVWTQIGPAGPVLNVNNDTLDIAVNLNGEIGYANLLGAPYAVGNRDLIYTTFTANWFSFVPFNWLALAGFGGVSAPHYAAVGNVPDAAGDGGFNATIVNNGGDAVTTNPATLFTGATYNIAVRYDVDAATSTLWVNARSESDPNGTNVTATDITTPAPISVILLDQNGAAGGATVALNDLTVTVITRPKINSISVVGGNVQIGFAAGVNDTPSSFGLTSTTNLIIPFTAVANPNITSLGGGVFQAKVPVSGNEGFYQIKRQPFVFSY